jgi:exosome complex component CSL4
MTFIGDVIASENEYLAGKGTYVDDEGNIRAAVMGKVLKNDSKKEISVEGKLVFPKQGDIAIGIVTDVKDKVVLLDLEEVKDSKGNKKSLSKTSGLIFIANLSQSYLENPRQAVKIGDLIKGEITDEDAGAYFVSLKDSNYGVILGLCSKCRSKLIEKSKDMKLKDCSVMICSKCKGIETRKTAKEYIYRGVQK